MRKASVIDKEGFKTQRKQRKAEISLTKRKEKREKEENIGVKDLQLYLSKCFTFPPFHLSSSHLHHSCPFVIFYSCPFVVVFHPSNLQKIAAKTKNGFVKNPLYVFNNVYADLQPKDRGAFNGNLADVDHFEGVFVV